MANTNEVKVADARPVKISAKIVDFLESRKETEGPVRYQLEQALKGNPSFQKAFAEWTAKNDK